MEHGSLALWTMMAAHTVVRRLVDHPRVDPSSPHARLLSRLDRGLANLFISSFLQILLWTSAIGSAGLAWRAPLGYFSARLDLVLATAAYLAMIELLLPKVLGNKVPDAASPSKEAALVELRAPSAWSQYAPAGYLAVLLAMIFVAVARSVDVDLSAFAMSSLFLLWASMSLVLWAPRADLAADGLYIRGLRNRFIAFDGRETLLERPWGLELRRGGRLVTRLWYLMPRDLQRRTQIAERIRALLAGDPTRDRAVPSAATLALGRDATADYRTGPPSRDELWRIVESPRIEPRLRIDAARALATDAQQDDEAHFQQIARSSANPELRDALTLGVA